MNKNITNMEQEYIKIQNDLSSQIITNNTVDVSTVKSIAGVDLAYWKIGDTEYAVCCIVVLDYHTHEILEILTF